MSDHIHLLVCIPQKFSVSEFMGYLKGKSETMIFDRFGNIHFWSTGYYVITVRLNESTIAKYIREQETYD